MVTLKFTIEDSGSDEVQVLLDSHLRFTISVTPPSAVFALDLSGLIDSSVTLFGARQDSELLGIGAIKMLPKGLAELKSMHTWGGIEGSGCRQWPRRKADSGGASSGVFDSHVGDRNDGRLRLCSGSVLEMWISSMRTVR
jgi:hypothetical protein